MKPYDAFITEMRARAFSIPTDTPESDGTYVWDRTTLVVVEVEAAGQTGLGYTYASEAVARAVWDDLAPLIIGKPVGCLPALWDAMVAQARNLGSTGVGACAISAVDAALWDLKAKILELPLADLLGRRRDAVEAYGSGGFTSYDEARLRAQLGSWVHDSGCRRVKMKVGRNPEADLHRVAAARDAIGETAALFVNANGALTPKAALQFAEDIADLGVRWFEEPVPSDDLEGLALVRLRAPAGMDIAAGEYGYQPIYFRRMLQSGAVDVLQADVTRASGITGFLRAADLADAWSTPLSSHGAPALHLHVACAAPRLVHIEWFHDHARIEAMLFDGAPALKHGRVAPDLDRPGHGLTLKRADAERYGI